MPPFDFQPLGRVIFESNGLSRLGEAARSLAASHVLLVTDPGLERSGHPQRAQKFLQEAGVKVTLFDGVIENPSEKEVATGAELARKARVDAIVAVGGGSSMDCAKGINFILTNGGKMADYKGHDKATKPMLPSIGVPTTSGTGSEAQSYALISDPVTHLKMACGDKKAAFRVSILDPDLTLTQPRGVTAATGIDALSHAVESYVCLKANPFSRMASLSAFRHLESNLEIVLKEPSNYAARSAMQIGSHFAGMAIEAAMLGVCHSCANPLTARFGVVHGTAIGIMLPHVVRFNAANAERDYNDLCGHSAAWLADRIDALVRAAEMPTRLRDVNVTKDSLPGLAEEANMQWTARFNPRPVTSKDIHGLYDSAW
ncbi:MAG: iron-containing alcohol dehydrogenase [Gemmataceae bacterium]